MREVVEGPGESPSRRRRFLPGLAWPVTALRGFADAARWESLALGLISGQMFGTGSVPKGSQRESCVTNGTNQSGSISFRGKLVEPLRAEQTQAVQRGPRLSPGAPGDAAAHRAPASLARAALLTFQMHCSETPAWQDRDCLPAKRRPSLGPARSDTGKGREVELGCVHR